MESLRMFDLVRSEASACEVKQQMKKRIEAKAESTFGLWWQPGVWTRGNCLRTALVPHWSEARLEPISPLRLLGLWATWSSRYSRTVTFGEELLSENLLLFCRRGSLFSESRDSDCECDQWMRRLPWTNLFFHDAKYKSNIALNR